MDNNIRESIIRTIAYYDAFDYPLTLSEIRKYCEKKLDISDGQLLELISDISIVSHLDGFFYFLGRSEIVGKRLEENERTLKKLKKAKGLSSLLSKIPTIEFIGIKGIIPLRNTSFSDSELIIITKKNTLWITKILVKAILTVKNKKVGQNAKIGLILDGSSLSLPAKMRTLFGAHEIAQIGSFYNTNEAQKKFLYENKWILDFLPNILIKNIQKRKSKQTLETKILKSVNNLIYRLHRKKNGFLGKRNFYINIDNKEKAVLELADIKAEKYLDLYRNDMWIDPEEAKYYLDEKKVRILN